MEDTAAVHGEPPVPSGWAESADGVEWSREVRVKDFMAAVGLVNEIAMIAESINHHPDLLVHGWNKLRIVTSSHDLGQITDRDVLLAGRINALLKERNVDE